MGSTEDHPPHPLEDSCLELKVNFEEQGTTVDDEEHCFWELSVKTKLKAKHSFNKYLWGHLLCRGTWWVLACHLKQITSIFSLAVHTNIIKVTLFTLPTKIQKSPQDLFK